MKKVHFLLLLKCNNIKKICQGGRVALTLLQVLCPVVNNLVCFPQPHAHTYFQILYPSSPFSIFKFYILLSLSLSLLLTLSSMYLLFFT